jgi:hypothetical protein
MHISLATFVALVVELLISGVNLCALAYALFSKAQADPERLLIRPKFTWATPLSLILPFLSQVLYLALLPAWLFHWVRFYPGAPIYRTIPVGFALSFFGAVTALLGTSERRWIGLMVSLVTASLWISCAIVSVAA